MHRFFMDPEGIDRENRRIILEGPDVNHIKNVLRMKPGDEAWISDGQSYEYHCRLEDYPDGKVRFAILYAQEPSYELPCEITLFQGLPKSDKMDLIIQKAVELGAAGIVPVQMKRSVMRLDPQRGEKKRQRWQLVSESAAKQSRRMKVPRVLPVMDLEEALDLAGGMDVFLVPYELEEGMAGTRKILEGIHPGQSIGILIGPEGGFEEEEIAAATRAGGKRISLGRRILRTETAGMALLSVLMYLLEEKKG